MLARHHVKIDPLAVSACNHSLRTEDVSICIAALKLLQDISNLLLCVGVDRLAPPACEDLICMMMSLVVVMMVIVAAAALMVMVMLMIVLFMFVMMAMLMVVTLVIVVMSVIMVVIVVMFMIMLFMLMVMIVAAALSVLMMLSALRADHFREELFLQRLAGLHCLQDLPAGKL